MRNNEKYKKMIFAAAGFMTLVLLTVYLTTEEPLATELVSVRRGDLIIEVSDVGQTRFRNVNTVLSPQTGWISQIKVNVGAFVNQKQTQLATLSASDAPLIDPRTRASLKAQAEAADAQEQQAKSQLNRVRGNLRASESALRRAESVLAGGGVSLQEVESLRARKAELQTELRSAEALLDALKHSAQAARLSYQGNITALPTESRMIKSPISGLISWIYNDKPRFVAQGEPLFDIAQPGDLFFEVELLARDSLEVKTGQPVRFTETNILGRVRSIAPSAHPKISPLGISEQRVRVQIDFERALPHEWPAGLELEAHIQVKRSNNALTLPLTAMWTEDEKNYVFVAEYQKLVRRIVQPGLRSHQEIEILSGLDASELVVRFPNSAMREGLRISARI